MPRYLNSADYMELYNEALKNDGLDERFSSDLIGKYRNRTENGVYRISRRRLLFR